MRMRNSVLLLTSMACIACAMLTLGVIFGLALAELWQAVRALTWAMGVMVAGGCACAICIKGWER